MNATFAPAFYYLPAQLPFLPSPFAAPLPFVFVFIKTQCGPSIESVQAVRQPAAFQLELINVDTGARTKGPTGERVGRGGKGLWVGVASALFIIGMYARRMCSRVHWSLKLLFNVGHDGRLRRANK